MDYFEINQIPLKVNHLLNFNLAPWLSFYRHPVLKLLVQLLALTWHFLWLTPRKILSYLFSTFHQVCLQHLLLQLLILPFTIDLPILLLHLPHVSYQIVVIIMLANLHKLFLVLIILTMQQMAFLLFLHISFLLKKLLYIEHLSALNYQNLLE